MGQDLNRLAESLGLYDKDWATPKEAAKHSAFCVIAMTDLAVLLAEARQELEDAEVNHRHCNVIGKESELAKRASRTAEWKVRTLVESTPAFRASRDELTILKASVNRLEGFQAVLIEKSRLLAAIITMQLPKK